MGTLYEAWDTVLGRRVALKVLRPEFASQPAIVRRFRREAVTSSQVEHPNVVDVLDMGRDEDDGALREKLLQQRRDERLRAGSDAGERQRSARFHAPGEGLHGGNFQNVGEQIAGRRRHFVWRQAGESLPQIAAASIPVRIRCPRLATGAPASSRRVPLETRLAACPQSRAED